MTQEEIDHILNTVTPDVLEKELIQDGTGLNYRNKKLQYVTPDVVIHQDFTYSASVSSSNWAHLKDVVAYVAKAEAVTLYRTWNISNHPNDDSVTRQAHLVKLSVDKEKVEVWIKITHSANYTDRLVYLLGDNTMMITLADGTQIGERDHWDKLTNDGYTPYQLMDQRIPELDSNGRFNTIY